jgi:hypothetical protein
LKDEIMKILTKTIKAVDAKKLKVDAGVRYWEDATVDGVDDETGDLIPFKNGDRWQPIIDIEKGLIIDWPKGTIASIHYKICDDGSYFLLDDKDNVVLSIEDDYVPKILAPEGGGFGDYIIITVDENGLIAKWKPTFNEFLGEEPD